MKMQKRKMWQKKLDIGRALLADVQTIQDD
jgi:hypothetical protein